MYAQVACLFTLLHISTFLTNKQKYMQGEGGGGGGQQNKIKNTNEEMWGWAGWGQNIDGALNIITNLRQPVHPDVSRVLIDNPGPIQDIIASLEFFLWRSWSRIHFTS